MNIVPRIAFCFLLLSFPSSLALAAPAKHWTAKPPVRVRARSLSGAPAGYSPNQIRTAYGFDAVSATGAGQTVAIVDAYDDPSAGDDLETFISAFNLPALNGLPRTPSCNTGQGPFPCFQKVYAGSKKPAKNSGWALETALDIEWAHAVAPAANILLVEAQSSQLDSLLSAVDQASASGAQTVSMSWGGSEFASEQSYASHFSKTGVLYVAASGDNGTGVLFPAALASVLAVGGTHLPLDGSGKRQTAETAWTGSGGGLSKYVAQPAFQKGLDISQGQHRRSVPDVSYDADPATGYSVYNSTGSASQRGWLVLGGTSAAAPQWAALVALANQGRRLPLSFSAAHSPFYAAAASGTNAYQDVVRGRNGTCGAFCQAVPGYDLATGLGSPQAPALVRFLSTYSP